MVVFLAESLMSRRILFLLIPLIILFSCQKDKKSSDADAEESGSSPISLDNQASLKQSVSEYIDTRFEYSDSTGNKLIIENSLPKGGQRYTDPTNQEYVYPVFWTRIINHTENPIEFNLDFPSDSLQYPGQVGNYFKLVLHDDQIRTFNEKMPNYGLADLKAILDNKLKSENEKTGTIKPNETGSFYIITLFHEGVDGVLRTGLRLDGNRFRYRINDQEIYCGKIAQFHNGKMK